MDPLTIKLLKGAAGHIAPNGYWHPGKEEGCPKCDTKDKK